MIDYYKIVGPILTRLPPENAQWLMLQFLRVGALPPERKVRSEALRTDIAGVKLVNPLGIAAGFDKDAITGSTLFRLGVGFVEFGTVTPQPQRGNVSPLLFRLPEDSAAINRFGFPSEGSEIIARRLEAYFLRPRRPDKVVGANIGPNSNSANRVDDYEKCLGRLYEVADYFVANVSSPNTPALRELQYGAEFARLAERLSICREGFGSAKRKPLFFKIAPELSVTEIQHVVRICLETGIDGLVVGNTTSERPASLVSDNKRQAGGLSGKPIFQQSTEMLSRVFQASAGKLTLIGVGGIFSAQDLYDKIRAGASACQIYTALYYRGPHLVPTLLDGLGALLARDGYKNVRQAVGAAHFAERVKPSPKREVENQRMRSRAADRVAPSAA